MCSVSMQGGDNMLGVDKRRSPAIKWFQLQFLYLSSGSLLTVGHLCVRPWHLALWVDSSNIKPY